MPIQRFLIILLAPVLASVVGSCASPQATICKPKIEFTPSSEKIDFSDNEKMLLCGNQKQESWKEIPLSQAEYLIKVYLKKRGYDTPQFEFKDNVLWVNAGPQKRVAALTYRGEPARFHEVKIRDIVDHPLSSETLDRVESFTKARLKNIGYPCPKVNVIALESTRSVEVNITTGPEVRFSIPDTPDTLGLKDQTLRRFDAFEIGAPYREEWLKLSSNRAENNGLVVSSQFIYNCEESSFTHRVLGGDKRLVTIGVGASTEEFPIAQARWKHVRVDDRGSNLEFTLYTSQRSQRVTATLVDYPFKNVPRFDIAPSLTFRHQNERTYNLTESQFNSPFEYRADYENFMLLSSLGPQVRRLYSKETTLNKSTTLYSILGRLNYMTHNYELYQPDPRSGSLADLTAELITEDTFSKSLGALYRLIGTNLIEVVPVNPPQWILGFRYELSTTASRERPQTTTQLPAQYFHQLGGDQNLRGFGRNELTGGSIGAMTAVSFGTEIRYAKSLKWGLEPFTFIDAGALGSEPFQLDNVIYYSPGLGLRWSTPFGAIRSTVAHGYLSKNAEQNPDLEHLQFFISFGEEF